MAGVNFNPNTVADPASMIQLDTAAFPGETEVAWLNSPPPNTFGIRKFKAG